MENLVNHKFMTFFEPEQARELCHEAIVETYSDGAVIFEEGAFSDCLYLLLEGEVEFRKKIGPDRYRLLTRALPDAFFGELGMLDGQPRSTQAIASGDKTVLAKIPTEGFMGVLDRARGTVIVKFCSYMVQRLRDTTEEYIRQQLHQEKMALMGEMLNTIVHDFKSPLSSINLLSSNLKEEHPDEETVESCDLILAQTRRMAGMAEDFLEFARGNTRLNKKSVNLHELFERFEALNRVYFQEAKVEFLVNCPPEIVLQVDESKLMRVLQNLTSNAVDAFREKGGKVSITVATDAEQIHLTVRDNGPGIPEEIKDRLFESFVTHGKAHGTGLGTAIVKSLIDLHGGSIAFSSSRDKGTTFYVTLPLSTSEDG